MSPKQLTLLPVQYNPTGTEKVMIANYEEVFTHTKKAECALSNCQLMKSKSCGTPLPNQSNIKIDNSVYKVSAFENVQGGFVQEFCYQCIIQPAGGATPIIFNLDEQKIELALNCHLFTPTLVDPLNAEVIKEFQGTQTTKTVDVSSKFDLAKNFCPIKSYKISKLERNNQIIPEYMYEGMLEIDEKTGVLSIINFNNKLQPTNIFVQASTMTKDDALDQVWSDDSSHVATLEIVENPEEEEVSLVNFPPMFKVLPQDTTYTVT